MRVDIWSDFNCPWCGIGRKRFLQSLERFEHRDSLEIVYHPFVLMPDIALGTSEPTREVLRRRKGLSEEALQGLSSVEALGVQEGFARYNLLENRSGNAQYAHELTAFAVAKGVGTEFLDETFRAYFEDAHDIFSVSGLVDIAERVGLDPEEASEVLRTRKYGEQVHAELIQAGQLGVQGVPFYLFGGKYAASGAQPPEVLLQGLRRAWEDRPIDIGAATGDACGIDGCD